MGGDGGHEGGPLGDMPEPKRHKGSPVPDVFEPRRLNISAISGNMLCSLALPAWDVTVRDLKEVIANEVDIPSDEQRLVLHTKELSDFSKVRGHMSSLGDGDSIMLLRVPKNTPSLRTRMRIDKELDELSSDPPEGCDHVRRYGDSGLEFCGEMLGPEGTAFEGARFAVQMELPHDYPFRPPEVFLQPVPFHPNVDSSGRAICNIFGKEWSPALTLTKCLLSVRSLLACPEFANPCGNEMAGHLGTRDIAQFTRRASDSVDSARAFS